MPLQMVALKTHTIPNQQFPVLRGHPDETAAQAIGPETTCRDGFHRHYFQKDLKDDFVGKTHREQEDGIGSYRLLTITPMPPPLIFTDSSTNFSSPVSVSS